VRLDPNTHLRHTRVCPKNLGVTSSHMFPTTEVRSNNDLVTLPDHAKEKWS
jgi:hypothetical protein